MLQNEEATIDPACTELVTSSYRQSYFPLTSYATHGVALASARAGNVIGGGDWSHGRLIPDVVRAMERSESVVIRNPSAIRPWQHVLEPLSGYLLLAERLYTDGGSYAEAWNFGPNDTRAPSSMNSRTVDRSLGTWSDVDAR